MLRPMVLFALAVAAVTVTGTDAAACGDKFIRVGRSMRYGLYVAAHPASILVYAPRNSAPARINDLQRILSRAGHTPVFVTTQTALSTAVASGKFDLILASLEHTRQLLADVGTAPSAPSIIPVLIAPTKGELDSARQLSSCLINTSAGHKNDGLAEIDHRMVLRLNASQPLK